MKLCWDNIEDMHLTKSGNFRKGTTSYILKESCRVCKEPFLTEPTRSSDCCSSSCGLIGKSCSKDRKALLAIKYKGTGNPNYRGGFKYNGLANYDTYADLLPQNIEECRCIKNNILQVRCSKCGEWFSPTSLQVRHRISALEGLSDTLGTENRFYCSEACKLSCAVFKKRLHIEDHNPRKERNKIKPSELITWRKEVLRRANYRCEYCYNKAQHVHHEVPIKLNSFYAIDPDNGIAACIVCHYKYGHSGECNTGKLAIKVCI